MATGSIATLRKQHFRALEVEPEPHFLQAGAHHAMAEPVSIGRIEHQETAASGAEACRLPPRS